jgi:phage terminase small subunit
MADDTSPPDPPNSAPSTRRRRPRFPTPIAADTPLNRRERLFIDEYLIDLNGTKAAERAGYKAKSAKVTAARLLTKANVQAALEVGYQERQLRTRTTADNTVRELARLAYSDISAYFDEHGNVKPLSELTADQRAAIASIRVVKKNPFGGTVEYVQEFKLWNKPRALEILAKHQGLLREDGGQVAADVPAFALPPDTRGVSVH